MKVALLLADDIEATIADTEGLVQRCSIVFGCEVNSYESLPFADMTGLGETVTDEIALVIGGQHRPILTEVDQFIERWGLQSISKKKVTELSGGWRKFLSVALFSNRTEPALFFSDVSSQLADMRLRILFNNLSAQHQEWVAFLEYDINLLLTLWPDAVLYLDCGDRIECQEVVPARIKSTNANYG